LHSPPSRAGSPSSSPLTIMMAGAGVLLVVAGVGYFLVRAFIAL
jgi:hypothetical protein